MGLGKILGSHIPNHDILQERCRPRILILCDNNLNYRPDTGFGLWRFLQAITTGVSPKPILTLADRDTGDSTVVVGSDTYTIATNFKFDAATPAVNRRNYDQIWIFGFRSAPFGLTPAEVAVVSEFMNDGGGVFATGDHADLGQNLSGGLPRIRHMREWGVNPSRAIPMGIERDALLATGRIDTVTHPGLDGIEQFDDQADEFPQRIFPNYEVVDTDGASGNGWTARLHPLLRVPGSVLLADSASGKPDAQLSKVMDVLPDHPHESVCYAVTDATVLAGNYTEGDQNFREWQPAASGGGVPAGTIVAFAVSGGRSVFRDDVPAWKPPVRPQMFGVISAYDGQLAKPYPGKTRRPGRIVCDSTWHHFVNVNLDGTSASGRTGLGTGSGASFTPNADLRKIYRYYRNIISWLQPADRVWCRLRFMAAATRFHPSMFEELLNLEDLRWSGLVGLGRAAARIVAFEEGEEQLREDLISALLTDPQTEALGDLLADPRQAAVLLSRDELLHGAFGALVVRMARLLPTGASTEELTAAYQGGPAAHVKVLHADLVEALQAGLKDQQRRAERALSLTARLAERAGSQADQRPEGKEDNEQR